ncbi:acyl-CoA thioesterase [Metabacillus sediminilitoris]|uniref:Acyl-CoA thioesterase n=1 Tax=Metabacillus sediminilitoris TaxID=2567941 RepID=A0A4S4BWE8_9BACI|nr:thioesterase family protein [Metabacillus sediminilitoris]QGQ46350.1 acyl-CoA thioesterase [Metabacillus sediminilitoris]THF79400.1 acyl-CoA thioesterase [Metabacillus sediminilitoris]
MRSNEIELLVNWGDTDKAGIVYYPNYFKWFDIAGHQFFRSCDLSPRQLEEERQIIVPMLDARCSFEKPLLYEDVITIKTQVAEINNKTIKLNHEVFRGETRTGFGYELRGWVKQTNNVIKAVPIPEDVIAILNQDIHTSDKGKRISFNA